MPVIFTRSSQANPPSIVSTSSGDVGDIVIKNFSMRKLSKPLNVGGSKSRAPVGRNVILALQRINLRPTSVGILGGQDEVQAFSESRLAILALRRLPHVGQEMELFGRRAVIECAEVMRRSTGLGL